MLVSEAHLPTDRAGRYLVQLCRHAQQLHRLRHRPQAHNPGLALPHQQVQVNQVDVELSGSDGAIRLPWGQCTMHASTDTLLLRVEAETEENLQRVQDIVARNIERFGRRDKLKVAWQRIEVPGAPPAAAPRAPEAAPEGAAPRRHRGAMLLASVGALGAALLVAVHLGLGAAVAAASGWLGWTAVGLVAVPVLVVLAHALAPATLLALHRRSARRRKASHPSL